MRAYRIADRRYPIFDGTGARILGGRWNSPGKPMIYGAATFAGALLEVLVHSNLGRAPKTHAAVEITIPDTLAVESLGANDLPAWDAEDPGASRAFGDQWLGEKRTAVLLVPSMVTHGREQNVLINPEHPDFRQISAGQPEEIQWDKRFLKKPDD
jgi:RES domain-containing protein